MGVDPAEHSPGAAPTPSASEAAVKRDQAAGSDERDSATGKVPAKGDLSSAHRGYAYQDLTTAFALAQSLVEPVESVTVDRKFIPGDRFDDISVRDKDGFVRRQLKWSEPGARMLTLDDFIRGDSSLRIDLLVKSHLGLVPLPAAEYRLCVAWSAPSVGSDLATLLRPASVAPAIPGGQSKRFRLDATQVWPHEQPPRWRPLAASGIGRSQFLEFCERFVIETNAPEFSGDLTAPGALEGFLLDYLVRRIGIGEYPNQSRDPIDVAARLIVLATAARTTHRTLTRSEVAHEIALRMDDGRVPQRFPVEHGRRVDRQGLRAELRNALVPGATSLLVGPPGVGKSWALTHLSEELRADGYLVARHYCYLEPGDPEVERRITTDALMGNLIGELLDLDPSLREAKERVYASTPTELERVLAAASKKAAPRPVVLIVDGVDHISRVFAESQQLRRADTEIVEELAALVLPAGACLVLGSQPGLHLAPFEESSVTLRMPNWSRAEVAELAERLGLANHEVAAGGDPGPGLDALWERSEGNPLYATFLVREYLGVLERGDAVVLREWLTQAPQLRGDIANYYRHLYERLDGGAQVVANVLGIVDFAVTEAELRTILPPAVRPQMAAALRNLRPILDDVAGHGGMRIFHESFRRFVIERLRAASIPLEELVAPVVAWLEGLGFCSSGKSFRYLLSALRRAGHVDRLLELVSPTFVSDAVAAGHTQPAVERNLAIATEVAAQAQRWPELARLSELYRSAHTCFEEKLYDPLPYWETFVAVAGVEALADRLVFEGRPTLARGLGLVLCSMVDDRGGNAPWAEYLALPSTPAIPSEVRRPGESREATVLSATLHGFLRAEGEDSARKRLIDLFGRYPDLSPATLAALATRLLRSASEDAVDAAAHLLEYPPEFRGALLIARARRRADAGDAEGARADAASAHAVAPTQARAAAFRYGATVATSPELPDPNSINIGLDGLRYHVDELPVRNWVDAVSDLAFEAPERLAEVEAALKGDGWYRCWLRAVVLISRAEALARNDVIGASDLSVRAFEELARDTRPFAGVPRASDLTEHRATILTTIARGLSLLRGGEAWQAAVDALTRVTDSTSTSLRGTPSGPILRESLGELLLPYAHEPAVHGVLRDAVLAQVSTAEAGNDFFGNLADVEFVTARALVAIGDIAEAIAHWRQGAIYLAAYGMRKDHTFFEVLEGVPGLDGTPGLVVNFLERLRPLADAVIAHTDGSGTSHALNAWFRALARADPVAALSLVARSAATDGGQFGWRLEEGASDAIRAVAERADPRFVAAAQGMLRFDVDDMVASSKEAEVRLATLGRLSDVDASSARDATRHLAAQVEGDHYDPLPPAQGLVARFALTHKIRLGPFGVAISAEEAGTDDAAPGGSNATVATPGGDTSRRIPPRHLLASMASTPPVDLTPLALMTALRSELRQGYGPLDDRAVDRLVNRIGYACLAWLAAGREDDVTRVVRFFARELTSGLRSGAPLAQLGDGFLRFGHQRLAALAFALAFAHSRGGGGWDALGGDEHAAWLERARDLDDAEARATLAAEIAHVLTQGGYSMGITPGIIRRTAAWGHHATAAAALEAAFEVVRHRLTSRSQRVSAFLPFRRTDTPPWSLEEALVALALGRTTHPELVRRRLALLAFAEMASLRPEAAARPLAAFLSLDLPGIASRSVLQVIDALEALPTLTLEALEPALRTVAASASYGARQLARRLLARIGVDIPNAASDSPVLHRQLSAGRQAAVLSLDWGGRVDRLTRLWPLLPQTLAERFDELWEADAMKARARDRHLIAADRHRSEQFWTPIVRWESELFETALHDTVNSMWPLLWASGDWSSTLEDRVVELLLPNVRLQLAAEASRAPRPTLQLPRDLVPGVGTATTLDESDEFAGWTRLAYGEREYVFKEQQHWGNPGEIVQVVEGTLLAGPEAVDPTRQPLVTLDPGAWFLEKHDRSRDDVGLLASRAGPLCGASRVDDPLGEGLVLTPRPVLAGRCGLRPGPWPGRLAWVDPGGALAVVFRTWRVRAIGRQLSGELPGLHGCEVIARPDIVEGVARGSGLVLRAVTRIRRDEVPPRPPRD